MTPDVTVYHLKFLFVLRLVVLLFKSLWNLIENIYVWTSSFLPVSRIVLLVFLEHFVWYIHEKNETFFFCLVNLYSRHRVRQGLWETFFRHRVNFGDLVSSCVTLLSKKLGSKRGSGTEFRYSVSVLVQNRYNMKGVMVERLKVFSHPFLKSFVHNGLDGRLWFRTRLSIERCPYPRYNKVRCNKDTIDERRVSRTSLSRFKTSYL